MIPVRERRKEVNLADVEHLAALATGTVLLVSGIRRHGLFGSVLKCAGIALLWRGQNGYRRLYRAVGIRLPETATCIGSAGVRVSSSIIVQRPPQELYRIWRNFSNLPVFMDHLLSVTEVDDERSIWVAKLPAGLVVKWDAIITQDIEDHVIAWTTLEGSGVDHAGSVRFMDEGFGHTRIVVSFQYDPPAESLGVYLAQVFGVDPQRQIDRDLRHFKDIMELGPRSKPVREKSEIR